jgi:hypothetical protein
MGDAVEKKSFIKRGGAVGFSAVLARLSSAPDFSTCHECSTPEPERELVGFASQEITQCVLLHSDSQNPAFLPTECICGFRVILKIDSDYLHKQPTFLMETRSVFF